MTKDYSRHIAENITKGSALCPLGMSIMGGAMEGKSAVQTTSSGEVKKPTPAQQALAMTSLDIYNYDTSIPDSDDEKLSDLDEWKNR